MFWGLILEPGKRYFQKVECPFHISMAVLEAKDMDNSPVSVIIEYDKQEFILCQLQKNKNVQVNLDLNFDKENKLTFFASGSSRVHLSGYLIQPSDIFDSDEDDSEMDTTAILESPNSKDGKRKSSSSPQKEVTKKLKKDTSNSGFDSSMLSEEAEESDSDEEDSDVEEVEEEEEDESDYDEEEEEEEESSEDDSEEQVQNKKGHPPTPHVKKLEEKKVKKLEEKMRQSLQKSQTPNATPKVNLNATPKATPKANLNATAKATPKANLNASPKATPKDKALSRKSDVQMKTPVSENGTPNDQQSKKKKKQNKDKSLNSTAGTVSEKTPTAATTPMKKTLEGGVIIEEMNVGNGVTARAGNFVFVHYVGRLKQNNKQFDSVTQGSGFRFRLGQSEVIKGWDIGVNGMKVGGKRKITIPSALAYGAKGSLPQIPPNSPLVFEVELLKVK